MDHTTRTRIQTKPTIQTENTPTRRTNKRITWKLHHNPSRQGKDEIPDKTLKHGQCKPNHRTTPNNDNNLRQTRKQHKQTNKRLPITTTKIRINNKHIHKIPNGNNTTLYPTNLWMTRPLILLRKNYFLKFLLINMDEKNWKTVTVDEEGHPVLKYDPHRDETIDIRTGEVVQGH